jgi:hypothetical protein
MLTSVRCRKGIIRDAVYLTVVWPPSAIDKHMSTSSYNLLLLEEPSSSITSPLSAQVSRSEALLQHHESALRPLLLLSLPQIS